MIFTALMLLSTEASPGTPKLRVRSDGSFSIIQVADVHTGEGEASWGAAVDARTYEELGKVLRWEDPSLAVLSGDMLTGLNVDTNVSEPPRDGQQQLFSRSCDMLTHTLPSVCV